MGTTQNTPNQPEPDISELAARIFSAISVMPTRPDPDTNLEDLLHTWDCLDEAAGMLRKLVKTWAQEAGGVLADVSYDRKQGYNFGGRSTVYHAQPVADRWNGAAVLNGLEQTVVDWNGEKIRAVPRAVLDDVLPAVTDGATSSKWRGPKLAEHGVDIAVVRSREWAEPTVKLGTAK